MVKIVILHEGKAYRAVIAVHYTYTFWWRGVFTEVSGHELHDKEDITWVRGWDTSEARAFMTAAALSC